MPCFIHFAKARSGGLLSYCPDGSLSPLYVVWHTDYSGFKWDDVTVDLVFSHGAIF